MQRRGILFLLLVVGVAVSTAQTPTGDNDETNDGFSETKCVKMIEKARARFDENKVSIEQFMTQYLCNSIGPKKCKKIKQRMATIMDSKNMDYTVLCRTIQTTMKIRKHFKKCDLDKECPFLCSSCKMAVNYLNYAIKVLNMTSEQAKEGMESYCQVLSPFVDEKVCKNMADHVEEIIQQILSEVSPRNICIEMKMCNGSVVQGMKEKFQKILNKGGAKLSWEFRRSFKHMMKRMETMSDKMSDRMMKKMSRRWMKKHTPIHKLQKIIPKLAKVNREAGKRFRQRAQAMRTDFGDFLEHQQGSFKRFTKKWGLLGDLMGNTDDNGEEETPVTIDDTNEENDILFPTIDDNKNVVYKDEKNEDEEDVELKKRSKRGISDYFKKLRMKVEREVHREFQDGGDGEHDDTDIEDYGDLLDSSEIDSASDGDDEDEDDDDDDDDDDDMMKRIGKRLENPFDFFGGRGDVEDDDDDDDDDKIKNLFGGFFGGLGKVLPESIEKDIGDAIKKTKQGLTKFGEEYKKQQDKSGTKITDLMPGFPDMLAGGGSPSTKGIGCTVCKVVVAVIRFEVKTVNATEQTIKKSVEALCALYPIKAAQDACKQIVEEIDQIIQLIEKDVDVTGICVELKLCDKAKATKKMETKITIVKPTGVCKRMCGFWRSIHNNDVQKTMDLWVKAKEQLVEMCKTSEYKEKCLSMTTTFEKAERQLGSVLTRDYYGNSEEAEMNKNEGDDEDCQCFNKQPVFITGDSCQVCQQMQTGLMRDVMDSKVSMEFLIEQLNTYCEGVPQKDQAKCTEIASKFNKSFGNLETNLESRDGFCSVIGYCRKEEDKQWMKHIMKHVVSKMGPMMLSPFMTPHDAETDATTSDDGDDVLPTPEKCAFCSKSMQSIKKTLARVTNSTATKKTTKTLEEKALQMKERVTPALREGFAIYCHSQRKGKAIQKVCTQLYNSMESIQKTLTSALQSGQDGGESIEEGSEVMCMTYHMC